MILWAARQLAGLGPGLTPSGDDVLLGVMYALWVWRPDEPLIQTIGHAANPRTTTLSAAFLTAAMAGEATNHWHDLVMGGPGAANRLLALGQTSGADAWAGFCRTRQLLIR